MNDHGSARGDGHPVDYEHRTTVNLVAVIAILLVGAGLYWVFDTLDQRRKLELCVGTGRRDCFALPAQKGGTPPPSR